MSNRQTNSEFSAGNGIFALYLLLFMAGLVGLWLAFHPKSPLRPYEDYYILFPETGTLAQGSVVQVLGINKGFVQGIDLRSDGVVAHARVERGLRIPRDSRFRVINVGLLGEREIEIKLGDSTGGLLVTGDSVRGGYDLGSTRLLFMANTLLKTADSLLTTTLQVWDSTLGNPQVVARLSRSGKGAMRSVDHLQQVVVDVKDSLTLLQSDLRRLREQFAAAKQELEPGVKAAGADVKDMREYLTALESHLGAISTDASWLVGRLQGQEASLGLMIQSEEFHGRLKGTVDKVQNLMGDIRKKGLDMNVDIF